MTSRATSIAGLLLAFSTPFAARAEISAELSAAIETTQRELPGLLRLEAGDPFLAGVGDAELDALLRRIGAGRWDAATGAAVWVVLEGFSREQGPTATYGRNLAGRIAGLAAASRDAATLNGVAGVLERFLADRSHAYSLLAQGLLSEKVRCGAASIGDDALVARSSAEVNPDRELAVGGTDGTIADRYGLHPWCCARATAVTASRASRRPSTATSSDSSPRPRARPSRSATSASSSAPRTAAGAGSASRARRT